MERVVVVGNSGSGKTTLARTLAGRLRLPHTELDAIFHQPGWTELDVAEFRSRVSALVSQRRWVIDGNYRQVSDLVWGRADTVVWLDLPRGLATRRVAWRTARRLVARRELWNGNREELRNALSWVPERSIIRWSWTQHAAYRARYEAAMRDPACTHLAFHRLRSRAQVAAFLAGCGG